MPATTQGLTTTSSQNKRQIRSLTLNCACKQNGVRKRPVIGPYGMEIETAPAMMMRASDRRGRYGAIISIGSKVFGPSSGLIGSSRIALAGGSDGCFEQSSEDICG